MSTSVPVGFDRVPPDRYVYMLWGLAIAGLLIAAAFAVAPGLWIVPAGLAGLGVEFLVFLRLVRSDRWRCEIGQHNALHDLFQDRWGTRKISLSMWICRGCGAKMCGKCREGHTCARGVEREKLSG